MGSENEQEDTHLYGRLNDAQLQDAIERESDLFKEYYFWLEKHMPSKFFEEFEQNHLMTIAHNLVGIDLHDYFNIINFKGCSVALCLDSPDADIKIIRNFKNYAVQNYRTFVSDEPLPRASHDKKLRICVIHFTNLGEEDPYIFEKVTKEELDELFNGLKGRDPSVTEEEFHELIIQFNSFFLKSMKRDRLIIALDLARQALNRDHMKYEVQYNKNWEEENIPSLQIVFSLRGAQRYSFLYRLSKLMFRHNLIMQRCNAAYINPYTEQSTLVMGIALHGKDKKAAWEMTDIPELLQELSLIKFFDSQDQIESTFVKTRLISGNLSNFIRSSVTFVHQFLLHSDANLFSYEHVIEGLCRHPELTTILCALFELKFHPQKCQEQEYASLRDQFLVKVRAIDTGNAAIDNRRKTILQTALLFIEYTVKTNFYRKHKTGLGYRLDPKYIEEAPYNYKKIFPMIPFGIFFIMGQNSFGFHVRFKDLARGGLRTVLISEKEKGVYERPNIFLECYNLAYTQYKKNKDIPEGGAKGIILCESIDEIEKETLIYRGEMKMANLDPEVIEERMKSFSTMLKKQSTLTCQRSFIYTLVSLVNCFEDGTLKSKDIVDYYRLPEYLYLGPDENMSNEMINWIAEHSTLVGYKPGEALISSKPKTGINHKEYGVTSLGVYTYLREMLKFLSIDPEHDLFTLKLTGGPDGDVAGNIIKLLHRDCHATAKILALTDGSGTIFDPEGLDLDLLLELFNTGSPIHRYDPKKLSNGGYLLDLHRKKQIDEYTTLTTCWRMGEEGLTEDLLSGNDATHLFRLSVHQCSSDVFIPAGGRPRTLNADSVYEFLDSSGQPTSRAIIEGANLYLTHDARKVLEKKGVLIIKDSSANKCGVICSSFEVLAGLTMPPSDFVANKEKIMVDILEELQSKAQCEARLLLETHAHSEESLVDLSDEVSERINDYTYQILDYLDAIDLPSDPQSGLSKCLLAYAPKYIRDNYRDNILTDIPANHRKAIVACFIASHLVYERGLRWSPSILDILPIIIESILREAA